VLASDVAVVPGTAVLDVLGVGARPGPVEDGLVEHAPAPAESEATARTTRSLDDGGRRSATVGESCRSGPGVGRAASSDVVDWVRG